jgi:hypothetical protein
MKVFLSYLFVVVGNIEYDNIEKLSGNLKQSWELEVKFGPKMY